MKELIMLDKMELYLAFGMRALIFLMMLLLGGTILFMYFIPDSYVLLNGALDLQPLKRILFTGFLVTILMTALKIWYDDYQKQYIPRWLR